MSNMALTKTSNPSEIERYFRGILELDKQNKEFSVNLDDVWQLCYAEKGKAVRALKANFIENVDFISIAQNGKNSFLNDAEQDSDNSLAKNGKLNWGGNNKINYYLTSACLEYFVARKVRQVFEVYRRVFHKAASGEMTEIEKTQQKIIYANWVVGFLNLNDASRLRIAQEIGKDAGMTGLLPQGIDAGTENPTLHAAKDLLKENNIPLSSVAFNRILIKKGIVHEATRPSRDKNKPWKWKVLNKGYEYFGQNIQDPNFQSQTQIKWYDNKFRELLKLVCIEIPQEIGF